MEYFYLKDVMVMKKVKDPRDINVASLNIGNDEFG